MVESKIDFKKPRQKMWGVLRNTSLVELPYGHETDTEGKELKYYSTNCYDDALEEAKVLIAQGTGTTNVQVVEFVPYDFLMQPRV